MLVSEILRAAQQEIVKHGWVQSEFGNNENGYCMLGALYKVTQPATKAWGKAERDAYWGLLRILRIDGHGESLTMYNDLVAKEASEVIEVFNRAIQYAKLKERV